MASGVKSRQIYEAQKIQTVERTRIWVREVIRKSKKKSIRIGTQNKIIIPIFDMIGETYIWSWAEVNGETEEWTIGSIQHTEKEKTQSERSRGDPKNSNKRRASRDQK